MKSILIVTFLLLSPILRAQVVQERFTLKTPQGIDVIHMGNKVDLQRVDDLWFLANQPMRSLEIWQQWVPFVTEHTHIVYANMTVRNEAKGCNVAVRWSVSHWAESYTAVIVIAPGRSPEEMDEDLFRAMMNVVYMIMGTSPGLAIPITGDCVG